MANGDSCGAGGRKQYQFKRSGTVVGFRLIVLRLNS